jgi:hypothetical protein
VSCVHRYRSIAMMNAAQSTSPSQFDAFLFGQSYGPGFNMAR